MTINKWNLASETLPVNDVSDPKFDGNWFECDVEVRTKNGIELASFWCCWEVEYDFTAPSVLLKEFDCEDEVIEWRYI